jgi:XRE family transcriptional regulator, regulator of sulfur utilization
MDVAGRFAKNLVRCRERAGLSQEELGVRASIHRTAVGDLERGERLARIDTLVKLAGALSIPAGDLLEGIEWKPGSNTTGAFSIADDASRGS